MTLDRRLQGSPASLGRTASAALGWSLANTVVSRFGTLAIGIVLARVLGPEQFGTFAVAMVALLAVLSVNEVGVSLAIVRWKGEPSAIAPTVSSISLASSAVFTLAAAVSAGPFAEAMGAPQAAGLIRLLALCVLINGLVATPAALMQRLFRQRQRMFVDQVNTWLGAVVSLALALVGSGALSLAIGRLVGTVVAAALFLRWSPEPYRLGWDRSLVGRLLQFGLPLAGASMITFLVGFVDQIAVGSMLGPVILGFYVLATNLANWPVSIFSQPLRSVAPAYFSRLQGDNETMSKGLQQVTRLIMMISLPVCAVAAVAADDLVEMVYGHAWAQAVPAFRWLVILAAARILFELCYDFLVIRGRSLNLLVVQACSLMAIVPLLLIIVPTFGIRGAALTLLGVAVLLTLPMYLHLFARSGIAPTALLRPVLTPVTAAVTAGVAAFAAMVGTAEHGVLVRLSVGVAACALVLILGMWTCRGDIRALRRA